MELISVGRKSFGKNFWRIKLSWKKFLDFIIFLEKTSIGKKNFGKTFLWKKFLKLANPWTNFLLEKNSFGKMYIGKKFLKNNFFGKNYLGNFYFGKNPLDIFTGCLWYGLVMTQLWSLVNLVMGKPKKFYSNSLNRDSKIQLKWQNFGLFVFTFFDILTTIYNFDLLGLT